MWKNAWPFEHIFGVLYDGDKRFGTTSKISIILLYFVIVILISQFYTKTFYRSEILARYSQKGYMLYRYPKRWTYLLEM